MTPLHDLLGDCDTPARLVVGVHDTKFCTIADDLAAGLPRADVVRISGAGHAAHVEQPQPTADAVAAFIAASEAIRAETGAGG